MRRFISHSVECQVDTVRGRGPYAFRIHGQVYHRSGPLHPGDGEQRRYAQLYILDTETAAQERLKIRQNSSCDSALMRDLSTLIAQLSPFARSYKMMSEVCF